MNAGPLRIALWCRRLGLAIAGRRLRNMSPVNNPPRRNNISVKSTTAETPREPKSRECLKLTKFSDDTDCRAIPLVLSASGTLI